MLNLIAHAAMGCAKRFAHVGLQECVKKPLMATHSKLTGVCARSLQKIGNFYIKTTQNPGRILDQVHLKEKDGVCHLTPEAMKLASRVAANGMGSSVVALALGILGFAIKEGLEAGIATLPETPSEKSQVSEAN